MKPNSRSLVSFWKPSLERYAKCNLVKSFISYAFKLQRPGKHYVYVGKYLDFTILVLRELKNAEDLKSLCRKTRRAEEILFYPERTWKLSFDALLSVGRDYKPLLS